MHTAEMVVTLGGIAAIGGVVCCFLLGAHELTPGNLSRGGREGS